MIDAEIIWDLDDDPRGNVQHIAEHGVDVEEVGSASRPGEPDRAESIIRPPGSLRMDIDRQAHHGHLGGSL